MHSDAEQRRRAMGATLDAEQDETRAAKSDDDRTMEMAMSIVTILIIILVLVLVGAFPTWPHSRSWGYYPSGGVAIILGIIVVLLLVGGA